jgi:hypothetical protein
MAIVLMIALRYGLAQSCVIFPDVDATVGPWLLDWHTLQAIDY